MSDQFTAEAKLKCAERELAIRKRVYPGRVDTGRMSDAMALREIALMQAIANDYRRQIEQERLL